MFYKEDIKELKEINLYIINCLNEMFDSSIKYSIMYLLVFFMKLSFRFLIFVPFLFILAIPVGLIMFFTDNATLIDLLPILWSGIGVVIYGLIVILISILLRKINTENYPKLLGEAVDSLKRNE